MAFDKPTRNRLASFVGKARDLIADEFTQQFQSLYGISDKGTITPLDQLGHLDDIGLATAALLRERIDYLVKTHPDDREGVNAAVTRLAREQAFTVLNRLAAIRMAEKRGLIVESVGKGYQSKGFKVFEQVAGSGLGDTYHRYRRFIFCLFDELAVDLGVLFDRRSPQGLLFPCETALQALFAALNASDLDPLWAEDETIGWIYQYYNDPAERKKMREESAAPRNSRELAVRNQFFTPRYVVEFLTDNTLGRIWYEMTQRKTRLKNQCRYLVRRPTEIFLKPGETAPETTPQEGLRQEELLKQPVYIPYRPLKDPRKIGMLDPACGSMHFGLYAFDLFEIIYEEAWDLGLESLRLDYPEKEVFLREAPRLIIEHNIHGIDIDPRATQIAGLSLWLRAQKSWQAQHIPVAERPRIMRSNIVCAEPMPGNPEMLREFTAILHPPLLGQMAEKVFAQMQLAGEAGSLLRIEEEVATLVKDAKKLWKTRPKAEQLELSLGLEVKQKQGELPLDVSGISDESFWDTAEERIYASLHAYAEQAETGSYQRRLFAEDAARGFAFIDLCRKRYDVVVMNPPFGQPTPEVFEDMRSKYQGAHNDIFCSFVRRAIGILGAGRVGAITSRSFLLAPRLETFRNIDIIPHLECLVDFGLGVMDDAYVESAAYVLNSLGSAEFESFDLRISAPDHQQPLESKLQNHSQQLSHNSWFYKLPKSKILYSAPPVVRKTLNSSVTFEPTAGTAREGMKSFNNERFIRLWWEVSQPLIGRGSHWVRMAKGGGFSFFYSDIHLLLNWSRNGSELQAVNQAINGSTAQVRQASDYWYLPGATYSKRSARGFSARVLPADCIFTSNGPAVLPYGKWTPTFILGWLNSKPVRAMIHMQANFADYSTGALKKIPWQIRIQDQRREDLERLTVDTIEQLRQAKSQTETSVCFRSVPRRNESDNAPEVHTEDLIKDLMEQWDVAIAQSYGFDDLRWAEENLKQEAEAALRDQDDGEEDEAMDEAFSSGASSTVAYSVGCILGRWDVRIALDPSLAPKLPGPFAPLPVCSPGMLQNVAGLPAEVKDVPADYPLRISWPGILVDDENHPEDIVTRVREALEVIWKDRAEAIEHEACDLLGAKTLRDYFRRPAGFFADHLKRYSKSRRQAPIYWPLSTAKGSYTLWIYYHRLTDQTLHTALADFIDPKLKAVCAEISTLRESGSHRTRLEELLDLEKELSDFHTEIEHIIKLPWKPNLNDGVLITASPLWKLFRLPKWQKDLKACWEKLEKGEYDWADLAYSIWPKRVEEACKRDRSIAIAHGLEAICKTENTKPKKTRNRKQSNGGA